MTRLNPMMLMARLREALTDHEKWIVIIPRSEPTLLAPLIAALEGDPAIGPDDACRGEIDAFASPENILSLTVVIIRRDYMEHATLTGLLEAAGWPPFRPDGDADFFALYETPDALRDFLNHVRRNHCLPVPSSI